MIGCLKIFEYRKTKCRLCHGRKSVCTTFVKSIPIDCCCFLFYTQIILGRRSKLNEHKIENGMKRDKN